MEKLYGYAVDEERAVATVLAAFESSINFIDTSNGYGEDGTAERRIGEAIRRAGGLPRRSCSPRRSIPTRTPVTSPATESGPPSRSRWSDSGSTGCRCCTCTTRSGSRSTEGTAPGGPVEALVDLRDRGLVEHLGVAGGPVGLLQRYVDTGEFEVVLSHNRYTLLDRSAEPLFRSAADPGFGVLNAAPYGGGMLLKGPGVHQTYAYGTRDDRIRQAA